jgi:alanyl-tRNA synthetase
VTTEKLIELYDSQGISPEQVKSEAAKQGMKVDIPESFYSLVSAKHEQSEQKAAPKTQTKKEHEIKIDIKDATEALYFDSYDYVDFEARVLKIIDDKYVVLDRTAFYPTSGGQLHDKGLIEKDEVVEVFKQGNIIIHEMKQKPAFKEHDVVHGKIDFDIRLQLSQHHTAAHIINGVCRRILGNHVWQAGASKAMDKARLDITHYDSLTNEETAEIEKKANEIIQKNLPIYKTFMPRNLAEAKYGFVLYQGGAVPGRNIRVVSIEGLDVEACGGTHLNLTGEVKLIKILKTSKLQDGIVRIEFSAGEAAVKIISFEKNIIDEASKILGVKPEFLAGRVEELFDKWKKSGKMLKAGKPTHEELKSLELTSKTKFEGNLLAKIAETLKTQPEHVVKTITRFTKELEENKKKLS